MDGIPGAEILGQVIKLTEGYVVVSNGVTVAARTTKELGRKVALMAEASERLKVQLTTVPDFTPQPITGPVEVTHWDDAQDEEILPKVVALQFQRENLDKLCWAYVSDDINAEHWRDGVAKACPDLDQREIGEALDTVLGKWSAQHSITQLNTDPELGDTSDDPDAVTLDGVELRKKAA